ncbi:MAG: cell division protein FtsL [Paracoccaceae bacterium]|jgi:hypothetical protein|nr:cell division protein FtsL [Paracoccaceae bacterium]MDP7185567.1 cell division protein FtsL [Paracoccaceae bacterium]
MRILLYLAIFGMVIAQSFWAYNENYETQKALAESKSLQTDIANARARLAVLNAEWAYLNRPDRLQDLVDMNFDRLQLLPLRPEQFGSVTEVPRLDPLAPSAQLSALEVAQ